MSALRFIGAAYLAAVLIYRLFHPVPTVEGHACGPHHHWVNITGNDMTCQDDHEDF
jgi:hypothetical protein